MVLKVKHPSYDLGQKPSLYLKQLLNFLRKKKIKKILDFGCGNGRNAFFLKGKGFDAYVIDSRKVISEYKQKFSEKDLNFKSYKINSTKVPYKPNSFDAILAWRVLHRGTRKYRNKLIKNLHKILRDKGYLIVAVSSEKDIPIDSKRRGYKDKEVEENTFEYISKGKRTKRHYYSKKEIINSVEFPGFKIISLKEFKEKTGHKEKNYFRIYWRIVLQKI